jgi:hypothetical protein
MKAGRRAPGPQRAAGTPTTVVQEHLGQSFYAITADIYSHMAPAQHREAADRLDEALRW